MARKATRGFRAWNGLVRVVTLTCAFGLSGLTGCLHLPQWGNDKKTPPESKEPPVATQPTPLPGPPGHSGFAELGNSSHYLTDNTGVVPVSHPIPLPQPRPVPATEMPSSPAEQPVPAPVPDQLPVGLGPTQPIGQAPPADPHEMSGPGAIGARIGLAPDEPALPKAVELHLQLEASRRENVRLAERLKQLQDDIAARDLALREGLTELTGAADDATDAREQLRQLKDKVAQLQKQIGDLQREDVETFRSYITTLELLMKANGRAPGRP